jgi:hypothetical protein
VPRPVGTGPAGLQRLEHPVEDAAVVVQVAIERSTETVDEARAPKRARTEAPGQLLRRWASTTRRKICSTVVTPFGSRSRYQRSRLGTDSTHCLTVRGGPTASPSGSGYHARISVAG